MKSINTFLGIICLSFLLAIFVFMFSDGLERSPIHGAFWIVSFLVALFVWKTAQVNTRSREFALVAIQCPVVAFIGGTAVMAIDPTSQEIIAPLHFGMMLLSVVFVFASLIHRRMAK